MDNSSPVPAAGSPRALELTPRSKVAKMLADIDNATTPSPPQLLGKDVQASAPMSGAESTSKAKGLDIFSSAKPQHSSSRDASDDEDDDLVPQRRPQGRAARRMLGVQTKSPAADRRMSFLPPHPEPAMEDDEDLYSVTPHLQRIIPRALTGSPVGSAKSAGLFVSPTRSAANDGSDSEELPSNPFGSKEKLAKLVAQKKQERLQREGEERSRQRLTQKRKRASSPSDHVSSDLPDGMLDSSQHEGNPEIAQLMSDAARPTRKASKRALLEMERETQRLARQQALAHQMKVKRKFTTSDLLTRFNMGPGQTVPEQATAGDSTASSALNSDGSEPKEPASTPPSSPPIARPTPLDKQKALVDRGALSKLVPVREDSIASLASMVQEDEDLPEIADVLRSSQTLIKRSPLTERLQSVAAEKLGRRGLKLARFGKKAAQTSHADSEDDELDIVAPLPSHLSIFDKIKTKDSSTLADSKALHALRHLSHAGAYEAVKTKPGKGSSRPSIGANTLQAQLMRKAKEQARLLQKERIADLQAKGVVIQTTEEREREQEVFENLLDKARQEAVELRKAEKAAAKGGGVEVNTNETSDDENEDEDYAGSGSESEEAGEPDGAQDVDDLVDEAAEESDENEDAEGDVDGGVEVGDDQHVSAEESVIATANGETAAVEEGLFTTPAPGARRLRQSRVIQDEDDSDADDEADGIAGKAAAEIAAAADDPFAAFNFGSKGGIGNALMSPTQAFQATMQTPTQATQEDSFDMLRMIAPPSATSLSTTVRGDFDTQEEDTQLETVPGSQSQLPESQRINLGWETQAPKTPTVPGIGRGGSALSETPGWEPTQDAGLPSPWNAKLRREETLDSVSEDHETQETVLLRISESPAVAPTPTLRRGRLMRRQATILAHSSDNENEPIVRAKTAQSNAFREMARRRREALTAAERTEVDKEMKEMLEEAADESDDEYAGLGGDDFVAPETEADREMIDSSHVDVDERQIAKLFAEKQRQREEEETSKLYKDLTTGALRRKQAGAWGLDEDEDESAVRRRQTKQREEARKRKLLLQDDKIAGLAQGKQSKGKDAFLKAIADDDEGDELLGLSDDEADSQPATDSQLDESHQQAVEGPLQEVSGNKRRSDDSQNDSQDRPLAKRRVEANAFRKPASLLEVRESLSFLLDEPDTGLVGANIELDPGSDVEHQSDYGLSDEEIETMDEDAEQAEHARQNDGGFAPNQRDFDAIAMPPPRLPAPQRRTQAPPAKTAVVDRLSLKRGSSAGFDGALGRSAWAAPASTGSMKVPSLLRRATTNIASTTVNDRGVTTGHASLSRENSGSGVKMGGSKKSSLAYQERAEERRAIVEASARRREEHTARIAQMRRTSSALGKGLTGKFE
ncbi:hypothetical protein LTR78_001281 [Recurvomyces mirabilis]|uniref:DNA replication checkpoint mediator MRC1 domain-containing protein n=1 Tax=Recurvomyces mirabilis TaxID=574656 RepID=A0AAE0WVQ7_9PEZI|nr:hypothetical protein LTR78_001281 [Recurvomyces mirabilis]KAK5161258.1 hypothetical protein LTS14_001054 [Recurvomyces mirabilis]